MTHPQSQPDTTPDKPKPADKQAADPPPYYQDRPDLGPLGVTCNGYPILSKTNYRKG